MRSPASLLLHRTAVDDTAGSSEASPPSSLPLPASTDQQAMPVDSDMVLILASLLCALVCVLGLGLLSRCVCRGRSASSSSSTHSPPPPKGLRKKAIDALPTVSFAASPESSSSTPTTVCASSSECAICLAEFADGESMRVLPRCGHGFHVACVDAWLRTSATCPSCRADIVAVEPVKTAPAPTVVVVVAGGGSRCGRCCEQVANAPAGGDDRTFLP